MSRIFFFNRTCEKRFFDTNMIHPTVTLNRLLFFFCLFLTKVTKMLLKCFTHVAFFCNDDFDIALEAHSTLTSVTIIAMFN